MKKCILIFGLSLLAGCSTVAELAVEGALENRNNSKITSGLQCNTMRVSCTHPNYYTEWQTPEGDTRCQCEQ